MEANFREYQPSEYLKPFVEVFWTAHIRKPGDGLVIRKVCPNSFCELIIHQTDTHCGLFKNEALEKTPVYMLIGMHLQAYPIQFHQGNVHLFAIRFKPEGFFSVFGVPPATFQNTFADMNFLLDKNFYDLCARLRALNTIADQIELAENYLLRRIEKNSTPITYLNRAAERIRKTKGMVLVDDLARQAYVSVRQLEREFTNKIGVSPKQYICLTRFCEAKKQIDTYGEVPLVNLAYECGYADQAHFIRDFKKFTGENPGIFKKGQHLFIK